MTAEEAALRLGVTEAQDPAAAHIRHADEAAPHRPRFVAREVALRAVSAAAAVVICWAFFLPWMHGDGPFALRSFSGFDFARLVRNFAITTDTQSSLAQVRASAIALYLVPALAVNAAAIHVAAPLLALPRRYAGWALLIAATYGGAMLALVLTLSLVPLNDLAGAVGAPRIGFALTATGVVALSIAGRRELRAA